MARFKIYSKDGQSVRYEGKPKYLGVYLNPSCLKFSEISSSEPIAWEVGDYVDYPRTGMRYRLYSIPQPSKEARRGSYGGAFRYSGVELYAATKELEIALFRDLVGNDNNIHFSTSPDVTTFENVYGIARRIQACMDYFYPGRWEIRIADFDADADAEILEKISTAKDFALSGATCLDALSKIYELWQDIGWIHSYENGKEVITIGYANKRIDANTTDSYLYGKGNGLTAIKKNQTNKDEFATRLYVYGSERNLPARYYNDKGILNAASVDIRNLMLPLDSWGKTDGLPDARKAYLENAEAVAKFGVIPKTHYFDSEDARADICPTIERLTIGEIRSVMQSTDEYYPTDRYADGDRADAVLDAINPTDDGVLKRDGKEYDAVSYVGLQSVDKKVHVTGGLNNAPIIINHPLFSKVVDTDFSKGKVVADLSQTITIPDRGYTSVSARVEIGDSEEVGYGASHGYADFVATKSDDGKNWVIKLGRVSVDYSKTIYDTHKFPVYGFVTIDANTIGAESGEITIKFGAGSGSVGIKRVLDKTFIAYLKQIGFNINTQASLGKGKTISMKTGACAGRNFVISDCLYSPTLDAWLITCRRQQDDTLGMLFPNSSYEIAEGDTFVLLDIAMPELYVNVAQNRLLAEGQKLLSRASKIQSNYEPSIDAKVMVESGRTLREGMFMEITDEDVIDNTTDYILIDTLSISEDESAIPTYKVTLRERRKVTYKGTPSATSATETKSVEDETEVQPNVDLTGYAKETYVNDKVSEVNNLLASMWTIDEETGDLVTDRNVRIAKNVIIGGDMSSAAKGRDAGAAGGIIGVKVGDAEYTDIIDGILDMTEAFEGLDVDVDLSDYYTSEQTDAQIANAVAGLNLGQYAKASDLATLQTDVDNIEAVLGMDEEAAGIINTWNEVKAFLDGYSSSDDLAAILSGMNADIAKRALDSDLEALTTRVKAEEDITATYKSWWDDLKSLIVKDGTNNIKINGNLIVAGDTSTGGTGGNGGADGTVIGVVVNGTQYTDETNGMLDLSSLMNQYALTTSLAGYLPKSGGTISGALAVTGDVLIGTTTGSYGRLQVDGGAKITFTEQSFGTYSSALGLHVHRSGMDSNNAATAGILVTAGNNKGGALSAGPTGVIISYYDGSAFSSQKLALHPSGNVSVGVLSDMGYSLGIDSGSSRNTLAINSTSSIGPLFCLNQNSVTRANLGVAPSSYYGAWYSYVDGSVALLLGTDGKAYIATEIGTFSNRKEILNTGNYSDHALPLSGGKTITGTVTFSASTPAIKFYRASGTPYIRFGASDSSVYGEVGVSSAGNLVFWSDLKTSTWETVFHTGNFNPANYMPLSGGTISASASIPFVINSTSTYHTLMSFHRSSSEKARVGHTAGVGAHLTNMVGGGVLKITDAGALMFNDDTLIHSGNIGSYALRFKDGISVADDNNYAGYGSTAEGWPISGPAMVWGLAGYRAFLHGRNGVLRFNTMENSTLTGWKTIAFTDSDITGTANNANKLGGYSASVYPTFENQGTYIAFNLHADYIALGQGSGFIEFYDGGWYNSAWGKVTAVNGFVGNLSGNASSATKLQTARTIWGQSFDGTDKVRGALSDVTNIDFESNNLYDIGSNSRQARYIYAGWVGSQTGKTLSFGANNGTHMLINSSGNVTIGGSDLASTTSKLYVNGVARATGWIGSNVNISCDANGNTSGYSGEINRFGGGKLWIQGRQGGLELGNSAGINFNGAVTMSSTLSVTSGVTSTKFLTNGNYGIWRGSSYATAMTANDIALYADYFRFECGSNFVKTLEINEKLVTVTGNLIVAGDTSSGSDIRFKDKIEDVVIDIKAIADMPLFTFRWNDREDNAIHLGSSAQYWEKHRSELVYGEDFKSLNYPVLGVAGMKTIAMEVMKLRKEVKQLKRMINHGS